jgi:hypothetical protein
METIKKFLYNNLAKKFLKVFNNTYISQLRADVETFFREYVFCQKRKRKKNFDDESFYGKLLHFVIHRRVARWHIFKPKIPICVNFGAPCIWRCWYLL